jgi:hypothetical protein
MKFEDAMRKVARRAERASRLGMGQTQGRAHQARR